MADAHHAGAHRHFRMLFEVGTVVGLTDEQLLDRFVTCRDEAAFTALMERHGPMVQRVCGEVLGDHHDAQDAFQATFLVLARQASSIRRRDSLASWLYGVALRVGSCARSAAARRRRHERNWAAWRAAEAGGEEDSRQGFEPLLHAELDKLPERLRAPVVLCYLEGRTYDEAAQVLRCPVGTIKSRLATARERLRRRLERLGLACLAGPAGLSLDAATAPAAVPAPLVEMTIREVVRNSAVEVDTTVVAKLAQGVLETMFLNRLTAVAGVLVVAAVLAAGAISLARSLNGPAATVEVKASAVSPRTTTSDPPQASSENPITKPQAVNQSGVPIKLTGRVVDEQGKPVPGADVRLRLLRHRLHFQLRISWEVADVWQARTDAEGGYRIDGVRGYEGTDSYHLAVDVNAPDFVEFFNIMFSSPGRVARAQGRLPDVRLRRGVAVTGRCIDPDGAVVAGAKIHAAYDKEPQSSLGRARTTDAVGHFQLTIPDGRAGELIVYSDRWAPRRVEIAPGGGGLGDIRLERGVEVVGRLSLASPEVEGVGANKLAAATAAPKKVPGVQNELAGKLIALESTDRGRFGWFPISLASKTDRDGNFRVAALKGEFKVWAARAHDSGADDRGPVLSDGSPPAVLPQIVGFATGPGGMGGHLPGGGTRQELSLVAGPGVAIRGTITGLNGKPAQGVSVVFDTTVGKTQGNGTRLTPLQWTTSDAQGRYALTGIPRGLTLSSLMVFADAPDNRSYIAVVPSGRFQGRAYVQGMMFDNLNQDQDPLDFHMKLETPAPPDPPKAGTAEDKELIKLGEEVDRLQKEFSKEWDDRPSPAKQRALYREKHPANVLANRFLKLAAAHPDHPIALSALAYVFQAATGTGDPEAPISKVREQAIEQVIERHLANPDIAIVFTGLQYGAPSPKGETLLRAALSRSPQRAVRAAACYELAGFLRFKAKVPGELKALRERPGPDDPAVRTALESSLRILERFAGVDAAKARMEAEQLLERVGREFADVPQAQFLADGPGHVQLARYNSRDAKTKTYGALADAALFELRNLAVGRPAPDIEGEDVDGQRFRLSDYHGKVVVLTFSGNWCGPCRAMYPVERELVLRLKGRPFAMLSVNTDPERETLRKSIRDGEITWRCWWDGGRDGTISSRWNILSFPTVFVIDAKGIIRDVGPRGTEINRTVDLLLDETNGPKKN